MLSFLGWAGPHPGVVFVVPAFVCCPGAGMHWDGVPAAVSCARCAGVCAHVVVVGVVVLRPGGVVMLVLSAGVVLGLLVLLAWRLLWCHSGWSLRVDLSE